MWTPLRLIWIVILYIFSNLDANFDTYLKIIKTHYLFSYDLENGKN